MITKKTRYWTATCTYDGKERFHFHSSRMQVIGDIEADVSDKLQKIVDEEWEKISPHPGPRLLAVIPGRLVLEDLEAAERADEKREHG